MDDFISTLAKRFSFKPKYIRKLKYMYICSTDKGTKIIKPANFPLDKIMFVHNIKEHLRGKGFTHIDFYYLSTDALPYTMYGNVPYVMTDYLDIADCDLSSLDNVKKGTTLIADFHKLAQGFPHNTQSDTTTFISIKDTFEKKLDNLIKMKKRVSKQKNLNDFEVTFIKSYDYFLNDALESISVINNYSHIDINKVAKKNIMICHNKLKEESILIGKHTYLTHLENISINHFIHDLASFISRYIRKHGKDNIPLDELLYIYSKTNYIDKKTLPILYALLKFPNRYIDVCQKFFLRRRNFIPISISSQMDDVLMLKQFHSDFIKGIRP